VSKQRRKEVVLAKAVARRWLKARSREEHRVRVFCSSSKEGRHLPNLLRLFRDGKVALEEVPPIPDLGITTHFDFVSVWSGDRQAIIKLNSWFEKQGYETTGIW
jgi:hypothetical protein